MTTQSSGAKSNVDKEQGNEQIFTVTSNDWGNDMSWSRTKETSSLYPKDQSTYSTLFNEDRAKPIVEPVWRSGFFFESSNRSALNSARSDESPNISPRLTLNTEAPKEITTNHSSAEISNKVKSSTNVSFLVASDKGKSTLYYVKS